ncbi:hypothetical protein SHELI_v1c10580 [Spiroplasma helicoides]|uniref:Lipoprotein n=1 Tax=Spiroplasma helicoides TaxID=216938 RepID=A0A1B3SM45_9MOLU|nr:lipoprotein [Spiroplasma helicoides]AOG61005.1 hypothetical protein SHELI_v1c10580 [Spiroplasma helicoides]
MKKLLSLLAATGLVATSGSVAVACNKNQDTKKDLGNLEVKDLGKINGNSDLPSLALIVSTINSKNKDYGLKTADITFDGKPTASEATIKAKDSSEKFTGSVKLAFEYKKTPSSATQIPLSLIRSVIDGDSTGQGFRPNQLNLGYVMTKSIKTRSEILESVKDFIEGVLNTPNAAFLPLTAEQIMDIVNVDYKDQLEGKGSSVSTDMDGKTEVKSLVATIKEGHEYDIEGYYLVGELIINIYQQNIISTNVQKNIDEVDLTNASDDKAKKDAIIKQFIAKNSYTKSNDEAHPKDGSGLSINDHFSVDSFDLTKNKAIISTSLNGDYYTKEAIEVTFTQKTK